MTTFLKWQVLLKVIQPYTRISIGFIAEELNISEAEVEHLLVALILDQQVRRRALSRRTAATLTLGL